MKRLMHVLCFAMASAAAGSAPVGAADLGFRGFEGRAGLSLASDWDDGQTVGVSIDLGDLWRDRLSLHPAIRYATAEQSESFLGIDVGLEVTDLSLGAEARYFFDGGREGWFAGAGLFLHQIEYDTVVGQVKDERVGPLAVGGYRWRTSGGLGFAVEARYDVVDVFDRAEVGVAVGFGGG